MFNFHLIINYFIVIEMSQLDTNRLNFKMASQTLNNATLIIGISRCMRYTLSDIYWPTLRTLKVYR